MGVCWCWVNCLLDCCGFVYGMWVGSLRLVFSDLLLCWIGFRVLVALVGDFGSDYVALGLGLVGFDDLIWVSLGLLPIDYELCLARRVSCSVFRFWVSLCF